MKKSTDQQDQYTPAGFPLQCPSWCSLRPAEHTVHDPRTPDAYVVHQLVALTSDGGPTVRLGRDQDRAGVTEETLIFVDVPDGVVTPDQARSMAAALLRVAELN